MSWLCPERHLICVWTYTDQTRDPLFFSTHHLTERIPTDWRGVLLGIPPIVCDPNLHIKSIPRTTRIDAMTCHYDNDLNTHTLYITFAFSVPFWRTRHAMRQIVQAASVIPDMHHSMPGIIF